MQREKAFRSTHREKQQSNQITYVFSCMCLCAFVVFRRRRQQLDKSQFLVISLGKSAKAYGLPGPTEIENHFIRSVYLSLCSFQFPFLFPRKRKISRSFSICVCFQQRRDRINMKVKFENEELRLSLNQPLFKWLPFFSCCQDNISLVHIIATYKI